MKRYNWETAFGEIPSAFSEKVRLTTARMQRTPHQAPRRKLALVAVAVIVVAASTAFALSQFGLLDTLHGNLRAFLLPEATELVQTNISQTAQQPEHATFTVEEAINDGHQIYAVIRVHGDSDVLLMDYEAEASWTMDWWQFEKSADTYSKRAYDTGRALVQATVFPVDTNGNMLTLYSPEVHYDGEDIIYTLSFPAEGTDAALHLDTFELFADDKPHTECLSFGSLTMTVPVTGTRAFYAAETPVDLPVGKMTLTALTVEQTPIATYMTFEYGATADATGLTHINLRDGIWVDWLDENGERYPEGTHCSSLETTADGQTRLTTVYRAFETMPEMITLRFHNGMTGEVFDTVTVALHPITEEEN